MKGPKDWHWDAEEGHIAFVLQHNGLFPEPGFGGCSCEDCDMLRDYIKKNFIPRSKRGSTPCRECNQTGFHKMGCNSRGKRGLPPMFEGGG